MTAKTREISAEQAHEILKIYGELRSVVVKDDFTLKGSDKGIFFGNVIFAGNLHIGTNHAAEQFPKRVGFSKCTVKGHVHVISSTFEDGLAMDELNIQQELLITNSNIWIFFSLTDSELQDRIVFDQSFFKEINFSRTIIGGPIIFTNVGYDRIDCPKALWPQLHATLAHRVTLV